jgi:hypothetical protein
MISSNFAPDPRIGALSWMEYRNGKCLQVTGKWMIPHPFKIGANNIINDRFSANASGKMEEEGLWFSSHILYTYQ